MKTITLTIILFFSLPVICNENVLAKADSAYQSHQYDQAINLYTQVLADHQQSAVIYYNLGNAYYKNNEIGKAIWAYHKAKKIDPRQKDIVYNLNYVSALTKDKIAQDETGISKWVAKVFFGHHINFWAITALICILIASVFFYLFKITTPKNKRGVFLITSLTFAFFFITAYSLAIAHKAHITNLNNGIVIEPVVKVHTAPTSEDAVAFELHEGAKFKYKQTQGNWHRIEVGKNEGWVLKETTLLY